MKIREIVKITKGELMAGDPEADIDPSKISTDSRTIKRDEFFIALKGPNFDACDFVPDAFEKGAIGALVGHKIQGADDCGKIVIKANDTIKALEEIAHHHRMKFKIPVIAVTGSNGKTTVKEMIFDMLSSAYNVLKSEGTRNNHIGVPQTLLKLKSRHDLCVLELGTNHKGEIGALSKTAKQTMAVMTNIGPSHLEFLKDLEGVFEVKREILKNLDEGGQAVLNGDDEFLSRIKDKRFDISRFGFGKGNDYRATDVSMKKDKLRFTMNKKYAFELNLLGFHNIYNALAAIAVASHFGIDYESMRRALMDFKPSYMRLNLKKINGVAIIDDSYNSNPLSMSCALDAFKSYPAKSRWVVTGDMLELGRSEKRFHEILGVDISRSGVKGLLTFGELSRYTHLQAKRCGMDKNNLWHCSTHDEIARILKKHARRGDAVLVKGSRAMKMEEIIKKL